MNFEKLIFSTKQSLIKHGPAICTTLGIVSMVAGAVLAVKETPTAVERIKEADISKDAKWKEKAVGTIKATWKNYILPVSLEVTGICLIGGGAKTYSRRYADLSNVLYISETAYRNLQKKMEEKLSEKQVEEIRSSIAEDKVKADPPERHDILPSPNGEHLFYDAMTSQYFHSSIEEVKRVVNDINARINREYYVQCNEFIASLGERAFKTFELLSWGTGEQIDLREDYIVLNGEPVTVLEYNLGSFTT